MIARLQGTIWSIFDDSLVINVGGVGYQVFVSNRFIQLANVLDPIDIKIYHIFKQENQYLCGFQSDSEMYVFKALLDVHGIGVKSAFAILSQLSIEEIATAVANQDPSLLCKVSGIGKKTAERIVLELKDKTLTKLKDIDYSVMKVNSNVNDAILGLISLGYQRNSVIKVLGDVSKNLGEEAPANELIVHSLKLLR